VLCAKGIEIETGQLLSKIVKEEAPEATLAILTGPTFAREIAMGLPSAITIAAHSIETARNLTEKLGSKTFRPYATDDVTGAEVGGAIKNVLAIACGIVAGKHYGDSARAALLTRGMSEMVRIAESLGGRRETLFGMCGMGDLVLTATSMQSRNFSLGFALGEGRAKGEVLDTRTAVTEGVHTAKAVKNLMHTLGLDLPIMSAIYAILHEGHDVDATINALLARPFSDEV
jgi:glycerol-3-phosphate dehydrogenase (NAD(P)+)